MVTSISLDIVSFNNNNIALIIEEKQKKVVKAVQEVALSSCIPMIAWEEREKDPSFMIAIRDTLTQCLY